MRSRTLLVALGSLVIVVGIGRALWLQTTRPSSPDSPQSSENQTSTIDSRSSTPNQETLGAQIAVPSVQNETQSDKNAEGLNSKTSAEMAPETAGRDSLELSQKIVQEFESELQNTMAQLHREETAQGRVSTVRTYVNTLSLARSKAKSQGLRLPEAAELRWDTTELALKMVPWDRFDRKNCQRYRHNIFSQFSPRGESGILEPGVKEAMEFLNAACDPQIH